MSCQEPLNIGTVQLNVLKWINTLFNIWFDIPSFSKIFLSFSINLWLCAPGLPLLLPVRFPCFWIICSWSLYGGCLSAVLLIHWYFLFFKNHQILTEEIIFHSKINGKRGGSYKSYFSRSFETVLQSFIKG